MEMSSETTWSNPLFYTKKKKKKLERREGKDCDQSDTVGSDPAENRI